jgi:itaconate CoA-transferase
VEFRAHDPTPVASGAACDNTPQSPGTQPLRGITVVALEQAVAAPFATRQLADLGARVIKIERPGVGDFARAYDTTVRGAASHFVWLNRSKESLTLDVKQCQGQEALHRLLQRADVFIQNLAPGAVERLGLGVDRLRAVYPKLIVCGISGYGQSSPYKNKKAYDLLIQSETGFLSITGTERVPVKAGIAIADIAGAMYAYSGILTALMMRQRTGHGQSVQVSLFDALGEWMGYAAYYAAYSGSPPPRTGSSHAAIAPYGPFQSQTGELVYLGVHNEREWVTFCEDVLQRPALAADARFHSNTQRLEHRIVLDRIINSIFRALSVDEIIARLDAAQIANGRMNTVREFLDHPALTARAREVDSPVGRLWALVPPVTIDGVEPVMQAIPGVGEHTDAILSELGFDSATIRSWHDAGLI